MSWMPYAAIGFISLLLQLTALRELLIVFSGNELDIGITLSIWLVAVGLGSWAGTRYRGRADRALGLSFMAVALLAEPTVAAMPFIRPVLGVAAGEAVSLSATFLGTTLVLLPLCFCLGFQFPLAVANRGGRRPAAAVYGIESAGAFAGGVLFTFLLAGRAGPLETAFGLALLGVAVGALLLRKRIAVAAVAVVLLLHLAAASFSPPPAWTGELVNKVRSRYGELWVAEFQGQNSVYGSGHFLYAYPDPQSEEMSVHLPMIFMRPGAGDVLALGGTPAQVREFLRYSVGRIEYVEMDPALIETSLDILDGPDRAVMDDERVSVIARDGRRHVKNSDMGSYDIVVMNMPPPSTANMNRFYTIEFFLEVRDTLSPGGVFALRLPTSAGYVGRRMQMANGSIYRALRIAFPHVVHSTEEYGLFVASTAPLDASPERLKDAFAAQGIQTQYFHAYIIDDAFEPFRVLMHMERLGGAGKRNSDLKPTAYLYNLMLWAEVHGGRALNAALSFGGKNTFILVLSIFAAAAFAARKRRAGMLGFSMFTTGYAAMALTMAVLLGYQAIYGYVYEMVGMLGAMFMVGVALGSWAGRSAGVRWLRVYEILTVCLALVMAHVFVAEAVFFFLILVAGAVTGCQFALVNRLMHMASAEKAAGWLYALDLGGSFAGAVLSSIIFIPLLGIAGSLKMLAALKLMSAIAVSGIKNE